MNIVKVQSKPKRRGLVKGHRPGWKKAIVQVAAGESIERLRDGAYVVDGAYYVVPASGLRGVAIRDVEATLQLTQLNINPQLALVSLLRQVRRHLS